MSGKMKYLVTRRAVRSDATITITRSEFVALKEAKHILSAGLDIEQQYEVLLSNYEDFEKEIMSVATEFMLYVPNDFRQYHARLNKRIINLLTTSLLYKDQVKQRARVIIRNSDEEVYKVETLFTEEYNKHLEYRFMEQLRNHVQHFGFPVDSVTLSGWVEHMHQVNMELPSTIEFGSEKKRLQENPKFKKSVIEELDDTVDLKQMTRKYVECLSEIQASIRTMILEKLNEARGLIEECINRYRDEIDEQANNVIITAFEEGGEDKEEVNLLLNWDDLRLELTKRNRILTDLSVKYVTGKKTGIKKVL